MFNGSGMKMGRRWFYYTCKLKSVGGSKGKEIVVKIRAMCRGRSPMKYKEFTFASISAVWYRDGNDTLKLFSQKN